MREEAAEAFSQALGAWIVLSSLWGAARVGLLVGLDDFALPSWFLLAAVALAGGEAALGLAHHRGSSWARTAYAALIFAGLVVMTHVQDHAAPGRFWSYIVVQLALVWGLWSPTVSFVLTKARGDAPAKVTPAPTVHLVFTSLWVVDLLVLVHHLGYVGWP